MTWYRVLLGSIDSIKSLYSHNNTVVGTSISRKKSRHKMRVDNKYHIRVSIAAQQLIVTSTSVITSLLTNEYS